MRIESTKKMTAKADVEEIDSGSAQALFSLSRILPYGASLDSSGGYGSRGRYSYACADPFLIISFKQGGNVRISTRSGKTEYYQSPLDTLRHFLNVYKLDYFPAPTPFTCGVIGHLSYDLGRSIEDIGEGPHDDTMTPDLCLAFYDQTVTIDHDSNRAWSWSFDFSGCELYEPSAHPHWVNQAMAVDDSIVPRTPQSSKPESSFTKQAYLEAVCKARKYIAAGDIYQVNLSQRFVTKINVHAQTLYSRLLSINPAPYGCFMNFGDHVLLSASPEEFLTYDAGSRRVCTSPIKGTRPRGKTEKEDERLKEELYASEKDRAENVMIVDLERNDLGKVCRYGSVSVTDLYAIETHPTVHHLVSVVEGTLRDDQDFVDLLAATFPGGSITGAPKLRSMKIIDELEPVRRGIYTGSAGFIDFRGNACFNILIRSFLINRNLAIFHAGGGIVADSDPEKEYQETLDKVAGLMGALGLNG